MATYTVQAPAHRPSAALTLSAPGGTTGDLAPTGSGVALMVVNGATPTSVTLVPLTFDGMTVTFPAITIAASSSYLIPLPPSVYGPSTVAVTYANVTTLSGGATGVAVVTIPGT